jgi:hypothetical protein
MSATQQTRVTFTGQDDGLQALMDRYKQSSVDMARSMIESARAQSNDGKELVKIIEEQIRAMERKARIELAQSRIENRNALDRGEISQGQHNINVTGAQDRFSEQTLESRTLRDILATLQANAREQARNDARSTAAIVDQTRTSENNQQEESDDAITALRNTLAGRNRPPSNNQPSDDEEDDDEGDASPRRGGRQSDYVRRATNVSNTVGSLATRNDVYAFAALTTLLPVVGQGLSQIVNKALSQAESYEQGRSGLNSLNVNGVSANGREAERYGVTMSQFMSQYAMQAAKAQGSTKGLEDRGMDMLEAEKKLALSSGSTSGVLRTLRNSDTKDLGKVLGDMVSGFSYGDKDIRGGDFSKLEEYVSVANQLAQRQISVMDSVDITLNSRIVGAFAKLGGSFKDPTVSGQVIQTIDSALSRPSSPYAQAMQFSVLSSMNPKASRFDLMEMQEQGIAQPGLLKGVMDMLSGSSRGNDNMMKEQLSAMFPQLGKSQISKLVTGYSNGNLNLGFEADDNSALKKVDRGGLVGSLQKSSAEMDNVFAEQGEKIVQQLTKLSDQFGGMKDIVESLLGLGVGFFASVNSIVSWFTGKSPMDTKTNKIVKPGGK